MDNCDQEDAKLTCIRQTIRRVVLPLVQALYDEDPSDTILFCSHYFKNLLENRENKRESEFSSTKDSNEEHLTSKDKTINERSSPPLQGSASEPLLNSQVLSEKIKLRETSSWDSPSNKYASTKFRKKLNCNLVDATSQIGDQPSAEIIQTSIEEDIKEDDIEHTLKENKTLDGDTHFEIPFNQSIKPDLLEDVIRKSTAPPYEDIEHSYSKNRERNADNYQDLEKKELTSNANNNISTEENETEKCSEQLSPNSPLSFITHSNEREKEKDVEKKDYNYFKNEDLKRNIKNETENPIACNSETFYGLAQKFDCAEANFNAEFQNAKEISDVVQGQHDKGETFYRLGQKFDCDEAKFNAEFQNIKEVSDFPQGQHDKSETKVRTNQEERNNNIHKKSDDDKDTKDDDDFNEVYVIDDIKKEVFEKVNTNAVLTSLNNSRSDDPHKKEKNDNGRKLVADGFKSEFGTTEKGKYHQKARKESSSAGDDENDDDEERSNEPCPVIDETWRKRWNEVHPPLGNFSNTEPSLNRTYGISTDKSNLNSVGESGDAPPTRFTIHERTSNKNFNVNLESHENVAQSSDMQYQTSQKNFYPDEGEHKGSTRNKHDLSPNPHKPTEPSPSIQSHHIPYSWRKKCKPQTWLPAKERTYCKDVKMKSLEGHAESKTTSNENSETFSKEMNETATDNSETSCKITANEESKKDVAKEGNNDNLVTSLKMTEGEENACKMIQGKRSSEKEVTGDTFIDDDDEFNSVSNDNRTSTEEQPESSNNKSQMKEEPSNLNNKIIGEGYDFQKETKVLGKSPKKNNEGTDGFIEVEPELNSPCGDSVLCENNSLQVQRESSDESYQNVGIDAVTAEYFEEILQRVVELQNESQDSDYEGLNFSSDSSRVESSDFSESDDLSYTNSFSEK